MSPNDHGVAEVTTRTYDDPSGLKSPPSGATWRKLTFMYDSLFRRTENAVYVWVNGVSPPDWTANRTKRRRSAWYN